MQGSVTQMAALVLYGNALLQSCPSQPPPDFQTRNSVFKFDEWVRFADATGRVLFQDVREWFEELKKDRVRGLSLRYEPSNAGLKREIVTVAFVGGGGKWFIEEHRPERYCWRGLWNIGNRERKDRKIWQVLYQRGVSADPHGKVESDLDELTNRVKSILAEVAPFARALELTAFAECFESGLALLSSPKPLNGLPYHSDLAPSGFLPLTAERLLGAVLRAWVFGGMGSWNDVPIHDEAAREKYRELSPKLYLALVDAFVGAVNSSVRA